MLVLVKVTADAQARARLVAMVAAEGTDDAPDITPSALGPVLCLPDTHVSAAFVRKLERDPAVERVVSVDVPYPLASLAVHPARTVVRVGSVAIGGGSPVIIAGPCSVEGEAQIRAAAREAKAAGAHLLRGGAFKPRTSPHSFQGLGLPGLELLARAGAEVDLPVVSEVMEPGMVEAVAEYADVLQVGSRNMQNFPLLRAVGHLGRPVLLKRGFAATIEEWLLAAEYVLVSGNTSVILCERGIRGFDPLTRNVLDLSAIPLLRTLTHLPVVVDPSHGTGRRDLVVPLGVAAIAAGADGVMVEMHPNPDSARTDRAQTIGPTQLRQLVRQARAVHAVLDAADDCLDPAVGGDHRELAADRSL